MWRWGGSAGERRELARSVVREGLRRVVGSNSSSSTAGQEQGGTAGPVCCIAWTGAECNTAASGGHASRPRRPAAGAACAARAVIKLPCSMARTTAPTRGLRGGAHADALRSPARPHAPGDSNTNDTTSPASSAFSVITSSLPAHFSILFMLFRFRPAPRQQQQGGGVGRRHEAGRRAHGAAVPAMRGACHARSRQLIAQRMARHPAASHANQAKNISQWRPTHGEGSVAAEVLKAVRAQLQRNERHVAAVHGLQADAGIVDLEVGLRDQLPGGLQQLRRRAGEGQGQEGEAWGSTGARRRAVAAGSRGASGRRSGPTTGVADAWLRGSGRGAAWQRSQRRQGIATAHLLQQRSLRQACLEHGRDALPELVRKTPDAGAAARASASVQLGAACGLPKILVMCAGRTGRDRGLEHPPSLLGAPCTGPLLLLPAQTHIAHIVA